MSDANNICYEYVAMENIVMKLSYHSYDYKNDFLCGG